MATACQVGGHCQVPQAVHMLTAAELLGGDQLLQEIHQGAASILKPLTDATKGGGPKHRKLDWWPDME